MEGRFAENELIEVDIAVLDYCFKHMGDDDAKRAWNRIKKDLKEHLDKPVKPENKPFSREDIVDLFRRVQALEKWREKFQQTGSLFADLFSD